jgi:hypothetical protein
MTARKAPEAWFWSHDIRSNQIDHVVTPGMRLMRLSSYGPRERRRLAALVYKEPGPERSYVLDLDAAALEAHLRDTGVRPVAITADDGEVPRFSVVVETGPGPLCSAHVDLDEAQARALIDERHGIADVVTYVAAGARKYAVIREERTGPSWLLTGVSAHELDAKLLELDATLVRLRAYVDGGRPALVAVAERAKVGSWAWYSDLDPDAVARNLEANEAYPVDLDATRHERGLRFTVVMYRDR